MGIREIEITCNKMIIQELDDVCDSVTGRAFTGSWVWDSALFLSEWMSTLQGQVDFDFDFDFHGKTVLELGAGTGLPGLTAAVLGAGRVVLTDIEPLLPGLRNNVEANGLGDRVEVMKLVWGSDELPSQLGEVGVVDLVLMSDLFYDTSEMVGLAKTLKRVCGAGTKVWSACEIRTWTSECLQELMSEGFEVVELASRLGPCCSSLMTDDGSSDMFVVFHIVPPNEACHESPPICI